MIIKLLLADINKRVKTCRLPNDNNHNDYNNTYINTNTTRLLLKQHQKIKYFVVKNIIMISFGINTFLKCDVKEQ